MVGKDSLHRNFRANLNLPALQYRPRVIQLSIEQVSLATVVY